MSDSRAAANQELRTKNSQNPNLTNIMNTKKILALLISGVFATTMASQGAVIIMQVQTTTDLAGTAAQAGWDLVDGDRALSSISGVVDGVTITVTGVGRSAGGDGGSYTVVNHTDGDLDNLLQGGRLNGADPDLTLAGLADGIYSITTYHHASFDHPNGSNTFDFDVTLTDANGTALVHDDLRTSLGATVTTADLGMAVTWFTVSGGNDVTLSFSPDAEFGDGLNQLMLNGFVLSVPEPSSTALLGLGGLALMLRRRRS